MILGLASPTYAGVLPRQRPLSRLLDRCADYELRALEASLPLNGSDDPAEVRQKAADLGVTWIGYWADDFVAPEGGAVGLRARAERALDVAVRGGCATLVIFGSGARHNRFMREPPLADQLRLMADHLTSVADSAAERGLRLGLLPHLDYRAQEILQVVQQVPALRVALDCANALPVCEEPVDAARTLAPHAIAIAFKDLQVYPHRSNDVTIWGTPIGRGSVDYDSILPLLASLLPDPAATTACIKLRLPPGSTEHDSWLRQSLAFLRPRLEGASGARPTL